MRVINFFAGPGSGKSTSAAGLFFLMKTQGYNVELVTEYAKDVTWEQHMFILSDQVAITGEQNRRLNRLIGKVDYAITDSPLLLGLAYLPQKYVPSYPTFVQELFNSYDNFLNIFVYRVKPFNQRGRNQNELEAIEKDNQIKQILINSGTKFIEFPGNIDCPENTLRVLKNKIGELDVNN